MAVRTCTEAPGVSTAKKWPCHAARISIPLGRVVPSRKDEDSLLQRASVRDTAAQQRLPTSHLSPGAMRARPAQSWDRSRSPPPFSQGSFSSVFPGHVAEATPGLLADPGTCPRDRREAATALAVRTPTHRSPWAGSPRQARLALRFTCRVG